MAAICKRMGLGVVLMTFMATAGAHGQSVLWSSTWDGTRPNTSYRSVDVAYDIVRDAVGGIYLFGSSDTMQNTPLPPPPPPIHPRLLSHSDAAIVKFSPQGGVVWSLTHDFPTVGDLQTTPQQQSGIDVAQQGVLAANGDLVVMCQATLQYNANNNPNTPFLGAFGIGLMRVSENGQLQWSRTYLPPDVVSLGPSSIAIGPSGKIYVSYFANPTVSGGVRGGLAVFGSDGSLLQDIMTLGGDAATSPAFLKVAQDGRILLASTPATGSDFTVMLSEIDDQTNAIVSETAVGSLPSRGVSGMFVHPQTGQIAISSGVTGPGVGDFFVAKFASDRQLLWTSTWNDPTSINQWPSAGVTMDDAGNVYAAGLQASASNQPTDVVVTRFSASGGVADWAAVWNGPQGTTDYVTGRRGIVMRGSDVVVAGWTRGAPTVFSDHNFYAITLAAATGQITTNTIFDAALSAASDDKLTAGPLALDDGSLVLAGRSATTLRNMDFSIVRVRTGCDGIDFNNNGVFPEDQDVIDFFDVLAGGTPNTCNATLGCQDIDFNNNGVFPEDQDVIDFFNVLAGGQCQ